MYPCVYTYVCLFYCCRFAAKSGDLEKQIWAFALENISLLLKMQILAKCLVSIEEGELSSLGKDDLRGQLVASS